MFKKSRSVPPFTFFGTMRLTGNFKKISKKISEIFFSIFSFLRAFVVSSCRKSCFRFQVLLSLRYGADLDRSRLVSCKNTKLFNFKTYFMLEKRFQRISNVEIFSLATSKKTMSDVKILDFLFSAPPFFVYGEKNHQPIESGLEPEIFMAENTSGECPAGVLLSYIKCITSVL